MAGAPPPEFLGLASDAWAAIGQVLLGVGAIFGAWWAIYNYIQSRRHEAAIWLQGIYRDFYLADRFTNIRKILEYHFKEQVEPLLLKRINDPSSSVTPADEALLCELDTLLNYFEYILFLEDEHHFSQKDRQAMLKYWLNLMGQHQSLKSYVAKFNFTLVAAALIKGAERTR
jgi:ADP-heptose:LPS heptosyltransferase